MAGLTIIRAEAAKDGGLVADRRLYRTADDRVVEEGDPAAAFLLVAGAGSIISADLAKAFGLEVKDGKIFVRGAEPTVEPVVAKAIAKKPRRAKR